MLDTNIVSDLIHSPTGPVRRRLEAIGPAAVCVSILTAAELRYGAAKKGSQRLTSDIDEVLDVLPVLPFDVPADLEYGRLRALLTSAGMPIGPVDFFIAAHALSLDLILVTANIREFSRVPDLRVENWLD
ncbi:MAG: type II toxin-antitoxin system VapC family toxin [Devosia sp.]|nr:type II toxin-antitoxin system VapC family toxin [Devosia sp.]